jgi:hypothetical protein
MKKLSIAKLSQTLLAWLVEQVMPLSATKAAAAHSGAEASGKHRG